MCFNFCSVRGVIASKSPKRSRHLLEASFHHRCNHNFEMRMHLDVFQCLWHTQFHMNEAGPWSMKKSFWDSLVWAFRTCFHGLKLVLSCSSGRVYLKCVFKICPRMKLLEQNRLLGTCRGKMQSNSVLWTIFSVEKNEWHFCLVIWLFELSAFVNFATWISV
jgi:hypothetical protein